MSADQTVGAAVFDQVLYDHLRRHSTVEADILDEYQQLVDGEDTSPAFRYLARMILEDEVRHHQLFKDLAETLHQTSGLRPAAGPVPSLGGLRADRDRIADVTERLLEVERNDAKELKGLSKDFKDFRDTTLWGLLIELMRDDTDKHIKILRFIQDRAKDQ